MERATGDFPINIHDEKLNSLVKSIQKIIKDVNEQKSATFTQIKKQ